MRHAVGSHALATRERARRASSPPSEPARFAERAHCTHAVTKSPRATPRMK
jgi:hypothetical protein